MGSLYFLIVILWRIRLFGGPVLEGAGRVVKHFRSAKCAALLAYLALHHEKPCPREALIEALWPGEADLPILANRLRVTLASLRKQLEGGLYPFGSVIDTSLPGCVCLRAGATWCDVAEFEVLYAQNRLTEAAAILCAPLLPGSYDAWVADAQVRYHLLADELAEHRVVDREVLREKQTTPDARHQLPLFLSTFLGRESELAKLHDLASNHRLLTLTGPGGVGKTRLAIESCRRGEVPSTFLPLTDCVDWDSIIETTINQLTTAQHGGPEPYAQLCAVVKAKGPVRLLFDNADHIVEEMSQFTTQLLADCPELTIMATSRQALELDGELVVRVDPFPVTEVEIFQSVQLFIDRLQLSRPDFTPNDDQLSVIKQICTRLEGLPLAIELAAAQINVLSLREILKNLNEGLTELKSQRRTIARRHSSIRLAIESSFVGLDEPTRRFLGAIAVFSGGFTASHAREVTGDPRALDRLRELVSRSLVSSTMFEDHTRFHCMEVIRQLALEGQPPEAHERLYLRHAELFMDLCRKVNEDDLATFGMLDGEDLNLSLAFTKADADASGFWEARGGAIHWAFVRGKYRTALRWIRESQPDRPQSAWTDVACQVYIDVGLYKEAQQLIVEAKSEASNRNDQRWLTYLSIFEGLMYERQKRFGDGLRMQQEALSAARRLGERSLLECALSHSCGALRAYSATIEAAEAEPYLLRALAEGQELLSLVPPNSRRLPLAHMLIGAAATGLERIDEAQNHLRLAVETARRNNILTVEMFATYWQAAVARVQGDEVLFESKISEFGRLRTETGAWTDQAGEDL